MREQVIEQIKREGTVKNYAQLIVPYPTYCTLSRFALVSRVFPGINAKKYTGYCIDKVQ